MTMTVTLCDSPKSDNICRAYLAKSLTAEKTYYDGLTKKSYSCQTVELGQPIRIKDSIKNLLAYNYGWIDYGDGFRYYFSISDVSMVSESMTDIIIELDPLATSYNQIGLSFPRVSLQRFNGEIPDITYHYGNLSKISFPYNPMFWQVKNPYSYVDETYAYFAFLIWDSVGNSFQYGMLKWERSELTKVFDGSWVSWIKATLVSGKTFDYQLSDVVNIAFVPCKLTTTVEPVDENGHCYVFPYADYYIPDFKIPTLCNKVIEKHCIFDARGNVVYEPAVGDELKCIDIQLAYTVSTITIQLRLIRTRPMYENDEPQIVVIPCETIDVYVDAWAEYAYRQRQYDIEMRNIQAKSSLANITNNAMSGAVAGAVTGSIVPGIGTAIGAIGGLAVGAVGSAIGTGITYHYGSKEQEQTDALYKKAVDSLSLVGNCSQALVEHTYFPNLVCLMGIDGQTETAYTNDVKANGYYYSDTVITDFSPSSTTKTSYAIKADVEIDATIPTAWKNAIADRFAKGLIIEHD